MAVYLIGYDLRAPGKNYDELYKEIMGLGEHCKILESEWLIDTTKNAKTICDTLRSKMDENDFILVNKFTTDYNGYLPKHVWTWLNQRVS